MINTWNLWTTASLNWGRGKEEEEEEGNMVHFTSWISATRDEIFVGCLEKSCYDTCLSPKFDNAFYKPYKHLYIPTESLVPVYNTARYFGVELGLSAGLISSFWCQGYK